MYLLSNEQQQQSKSQKRVQELENRVFEGES